MSPPRSGQYPVPLRRGTGSLVTDPSVYDPHDIEWVENEDFCALLRVMDQRRHKGTYVILMQRVGTGPRPFYPMFLADFIDMLDSVTLNRGVVDGSFHVRKRLRSYGLRYIGPRDRLTLQQRA